MFKTHMPHNKEVFEDRSRDAEEKKKDEKEEAPDFKFGEKIQQERSDFLKKRDEIKKQETTERFIKGFDQYKSDYNKTPLKIPGGEYAITLDGFEVDGEKNKDPRKGLEKGDISLDQVEGMFTVEAKGGATTLQRVPAAVIANGEVVGFIENAFSGGTYEKNKKETQKEHEKNLAPAPERKTEESKEKTDDIQKQVDAIKGKAEKMKGSVSVIEGQKGVTVNINFSDRQLRLTTMDGAIWNGAESRDNGQTVNGTGSSVDPLDLLVEPKEQKNE
jgi:hypothetical protein